MSYDRKPADDKIESYLRSIDHSAKAREIAEAIDYHPSYVGKRCRMMSASDMMSEADIINRQEGGFIIGHDIPGRDNPTILNSDRSYLLNLVKEHEPDRLSKARSMSVKELQKFIKREIATSTYPLGNKTVSYSLG
jgi:predicted amidohydrolase YtcJ